MSDIAIRVEGLSKQYQIGGAQGRYQTFREAILRTAAAPVRWARGERQENNTIWALDDVSFEVKQGEVIGVIGRNGAGKSTLLKILSRITKPTRGRVELNGRVGSLLEVGTGFHPELTGRENIFLNGAILGMTRREIQRKFDEIVDFSGVEKFIDTPVKRYSSGMQVRLAFSVAAHLEPEILLVDEVLAVGDAEFQKKSLGKMDEVSKTGRTVLFVSHNMGAIKNLCSKGLLLDEGALVYQGPIDGVVDHYIQNGVRKYYKTFSPNPRSPIRISRIELRNHNGNIPDNFIDTKDGFRIRISYSVNSEVKGAHTFLRLNLPYGDTLLATGDSDVDVNRLGVRKPGKYVCEIEIPPNLLGAGQYSVTWSAGIPFQINYDVEFDALSFQLADNKSMRNEFSQNARPGLLALDLPWEYSEWANSHDN